MHCCRRSCVGRNVVGGGTASILRVVVYFRGCFLLQTHPRLGSFVGSFSNMVIIIIIILVDWVVAVPTFCGGAAHTDTLDSSASSLTHIYLVPYACGACISFSPRNEPFVWVVVDVERASAIIVGLPSIHCRFRSSTMALLASIDRRA